MAILITKASGEVVPFESEKIVASLMKAGAPEHVALDIATTVEKEIYEGISTKRIYQHAFKLLKKHHRPLAGKYHLKRGIMELGPSGFPFEQFIGALLKENGFKVNVGQIIQGHCVEHEVDVVAEKESHHYLVECKYHNEPGISCDVKIPLYIFARFKDVEKNWKTLPEHSEKFHQAWLVTNTKFTSSAIQYGKCIGMNLIGWSYPAKNNLQQLVEEHRLYPITCITSLSQKEKQLLLMEHVVLCRDMCANKGILSKIGLSKNRQKIVFEEGRRLCEGNGGF